MCRRLAVTIVTLALVVVHSALPGLGQERAFHLGPRFPRDLASVILVGIIVIGMTVVGSFIGI